VNARGGGDDFAGFYAEAVQRVIAGLAVYCGDWDAAGDAAAEAFTRACERWGRVSRIERPEGWVYRVGVNVLGRRRHRTTREHQLLERLEVAPVVVEPQIDPALWDAVRRLPERERQAIALRYVVDLTQAEIASMMRVAPGTVAATLAHARARLHEMLSDNAEVTE
jgi:RNA polymerase sigma factor (sigma-70 family)